jgi:hypothetical protein
MSKLRYEDVKSRAAEFLALTSLTVDEFELLVPEFEKAYQAHMSKWRVDGKQRTKRRYITYRNCPLATAEERLLFVLSYEKCNPLQSTHGTLFGMGQGKVNRWLHVLLPVLRSALRNLGVSPSRSVSELSERLGIVFREESEITAAGDAPLPLFAMMARNAGLSVRKMPPNRRSAIAARKRRIPSKICS